MNEKRGIGNIPFGKKSIGPGLPVVVIAEIGVNHEGDYSTCARMIEETAQAGADAVKLQTIDPRENYVPGTSSFEAFSKAELTPGQTAQAFDLARSLGLEVFTTVGDFKTLAWVEELNPAAYKISSGLITHIPLIRLAAKTGRTLLMSTGMTGLGPVDKAVAEARAAGCENIGIFQCTSVYPALPETLNLRAIRSLSGRYMVPAGFSDHSEGFDAAALAVAAGAAMIEKHFSLDPSRHGFDHRVSVDPAGLAALVKRVRRAEAMLGHADKSCGPEQLDAGQRFLRSIVAREPIPAGETITMERIGFMRTASDARGLSPERFEAVIGRRAARGLSQYESITEDDIE